jgi:hypothetical protein
MLRTFGSVLSLICVLCLPRWAHAQDLACLRPSDAGSEVPCELRLSHNPAAEILAVRVTKVGLPEVGKKVLFYMPKGGWRDSAVTNGRGEAQVVWLAERITDTTWVHVRVENDNRSHATKIRIVPPPSAAFLSRGRSPRRTYGYIERQMRDSVEVDISGPNSSAECSRVSVMFEASDDGAVAPKTAAGTWNAPTNTCFAWAHWRLGKVIGTQTLSARVGASTHQSIVATAGARSPPTLVAGIALASVPGYEGLEIRETKIRVTRTLEGGGNLAFDSIAADTISKRIPSRWRAFPIIGIDWPLTAATPHLRMSLSGSATNPRDDWFVGISLLHLVPRSFGGIGFRQESTGLNLHLVSHWGERTTVTNPVECRTGAIACQTESPQRFLGAGVALTLNGHTLLETAKALVSPIF